MKRILVCGSRDYDNAPNVFRTLDRLHAKGEFMLIQGGASGADRLARDWAEQGTHPFATVPAHWDKLSRKAGPIRNTWMLGLEPHMAIAFPGGRGTADMINKALAAGIETYGVDDSGEITRLRLGETHP